MKPFLILQLRENDDAADGEFEAFLKYGELSHDEVVRVRMERDELPTIDPDTYSGILVGGGPWNVSDHEKGPRQREAEAWLHHLLDRIVAGDFPYLGACYGLGALTASRGGIVSKERYGENVGAVDVDLTDEATRDPVLAGLPGRFRAFVGHKEACQTLPSGAVWLAKSSTCPFQMYRLGHNVYGCQFHPELDAEVLCVRIDVYKNAGYFPPEEAESLKGLVSKETITVPMQILRRFVERYRR